MSSKGAPGEHCAGQAQGSRRVVQECSRQSPLPKPPVALGRHRTSPLNTVWSRALLRATGPCIMKPLTGLSTRLCTQPVLNKCLSSECPRPRLQNFSAHSLCCLHWGPGTQDSGASLPTPPRRSLQLGRHGGQWDSAVSNVRPWRVGVPGRGAETRGGTRQKWTWSSTQGEGIEAEVRVWTHFSENKAIGWSEGWGR